MTTVVPPAVAQRTRALRPPVSGQEVVLAGVIALLWIALGVATPAFLSAGSLQALLVEVAPVAIMGVGMTLVIITAGIDVSVGAIMMVSGVITAQLLAGPGVPAVIAIVVAVLVGSLLGALNGLLVAYGRVHAIIVTFGTANLFLFAGLQIFGSRTVNGIPDTLAFLGRGDAGRTLGVPHSFLLTVLVAVAAGWYLRHSVAGRHLFAIGGNAAAARLAGIRVPSRTASVYLLTGALVGVAAIFTLAKGTSTLDQSIGAGRELAVIAATVIGGTSIVGGRGSVLGTVLGALLVQSVISGVIQVGWPSQLADLFVGLFVIVAVGADLLRRREGRWTA